MHVKCKLNNLCINKIVFLYEMKIMFCENPNGKILKYLRY